MAILNLLKTRKNKSSSIKDSEPTNIHEPANIYEPTIFAEQAAILSEHIKNLSESTNILEQINNLSERLTTLLEIANYSEAMNSKHEKYDSMHDGIFKFVFGCGNRKDISKNFANDIFDPVREDYPQYARIDKIHFKDCVLNPLSYNGKQSHNQFMFADQDESLYVMVMQIEKECLFTERMNHYAIETWYNQIKSGNKCNLRKPVSLIAITAFDVFPEDDRYLTYKKIINELVDEEGKKKCDNICRIVYINLAKFNVPSHQLKTNIEWWCYFLKQLSENRRDYVNMALGKYNTIVCVYNKLLKSRMSNMQVEQYNNEELELTAKKNELGAVEDDAEKRGYKKVKVEERLESKK